MEKLTEPDDDSILNISFNQDSSFFAIGTESRFKIYQTYPLQERMVRKMNGGIGAIEMLYKSNIIALLGGGKIPKFSTNRVILWDANDDRVVSEFKFLTPVINIKLKKDLLFAICAKRIYIFNIKTYNIRDTIDTGENKKGLFAYNNDPNFTIIGYIAINDCKKISIKNLKKNKVISFTAQEDIISYMTMSYDGKLIVSSNDTGTIIKVHSCVDGALIQEFKRGNSKVENIFITIDNSSRFVAVSSSKGTIHFFYLGNGLKKLQEIEDKKETDKKEIDKKTVIKKDGKNKSDKKKSEKNKSEIKQIDIKEPDKKESGKKEPEKKKLDKNEFEIIEADNLDFKKNKTFIKNDIKEIDKIEFEQNGFEIIYSSKLEAPKANIEVKNPKMYFGLSKTEKSFAQFRIKSHKSICSFIGEDLLIIITNDYKYYLIQIDKQKGGNCKIIKELDLTKLKNEK